jgi:type I restriction enzyme S subunit
MKKYNLSQVVGENGVFGDGDWIETKDQDPNGDVRLIQLADIGDGIFINKSARYLTSQKAKQLKCTFLQKGDLLIARMPDPLGRACIFPGDERRCVTAVDVCIVRPDGTIAETIYLKYLVNYNWFRNKIKRYATGTTRKRISRKNLDKITFTLPTKNDQIRIVSLLSRVEGLIDNRKKSIQMLNELLKSTFLEMFGDPVRNEKKWELSPLDKLGSLDRGVSKNRPRNAPELLGGKYPLIQKGEVSNSWLYITEHKQTYSEIGFQQSKMWPKNTLCITIAANIAKTSILGFDSCFPDSIVGFIPFTDESNVMYVHYLFKFFQQILEKNAPQAAQKNINLGILRNLKVPKPDIKLQNKFAAIVERVYSLSKKYESSLEELENLFGSLSQRAFRGELDLSKIPAAEHRLPVLPFTFREEPDSVKIPVDKSLLVKDLIRQGESLKSSNQLKKAIKAYQESIEISKQLNEMKSLAVSLAGLGEAQRMMSQHRQAEKALRESVDISKHIKEMNLAVSSLRELGEVQKLMNQPAEALKTFQESVNISKQIKDMNSVASSLMELGEIRKIMNHHKEAEKAFRESTKIFKQLGIKPKRKVVTPDIISKQEQRIASLTDFIKKIILKKSKEAFTFKKLMGAISNVPTKTMPPTFEELKEVMTKLLEEDGPFLRQECDWESEDSGAEQQIVFKVNR